MRVNPSQFVNFVVAGGIAAVANVSSRFVFNEFVSFEISVVFAYLVGMAVAFILNKYIVFNVNGAAQAQVIRFALVNLCSLSAVWVTSVFLAEILFPYLSFNWHAEDLAHIIGVMIPAVLSYLGHKYYTFS